MTAVDDLLAQGNVEPERDRWGRYVIPHPHTGAEASWTRATTISSTLAEKFALQTWAQRMTALGLAARPDLYARVASCTADDKAALNRLVDEAKEAAAASKGANLGTALHRFTERLDHGEEVVAPAPLDRDLLAYRDGLTRAGFEVTAGMIEQVVTVPSIMVAGTFDRIGTISGSDLPMVADLKTGQWLGWDEIALQLAIYANAETIYDLRAREHRAMPAVDRDHALVIHLPAGQATCTLWLVDIAAGWEAVQQAMWVRAWRKRKNLASALTQTSAVVPQPTASEGEATEGRDGTPLPVPVTPRLLNGLVGSNLRRKVEAMTDEQRAALSIELNERGLPRLSEATPAHAHEWVQAVKAVAGPMLGRPVERTLPSGTVLNRPPTREWLTARIEGLVGIDGGITALRAALDAAQLPKLSECPDGLLDEFAAACSVAEAAVDAPFAPAVADVPADPFAGLPGNEKSHAGDHTAGDAATANGTSPAVVLPPDVAEIVGDLDADMVETLRAELGGRAWNEATADDLEQLRVLVAAIDRCLVAFTYDGERPVLMTTDTALDAITEAHGGKGAALKAAQQHARTLGRTAPRTATAAAQDPVLVAHTATKSA